ncbi:MAG: cation:proton antiporter [Bacteroidaceae bacterium]|nr:cation:proton antiporter [Bacteroidaceae bacterium]
MPIVTDPTWIFFIVLGVILFAPMLMRRLHIPSVVGMILAGVLVGPHGFHVLDYDDSFELFGKVGLYYIMFLASLEMNVQDVRQTRWQTAMLGSLSFLCPAAMGLLLARLWGFGWASSVLIGAMLSSHTLVSYPIVMRYGLSRRRSVSISTGATILADVLTLLTLAVVAGLHKEGAGAVGIARLPLMVTAIGAIIVFVFPRLCHMFFRRYNEVVVQYVFVLALVFLGAGLMELAGFEGILGAFLVGIVLGRLIPPSSPLMSHVEFIGNSIFIPYFLIGVGMIIDPAAFLDWRATLPLSVLMLAVAVGGKWVAAALTGHAYHIATSDRNLMFGLTTSRAAATLAVALVGYKIVLPDGEPLLSGMVFNAAMIVILGTCVVSSFVTERTARHIALTKPEDNTSAQNAGERILVALSREDSIKPLMELALMMRDSHPSVQLSAVSLVLEDNPELHKQSQGFLTEAAAIAASVGAPLATHNRWAVNRTTALYHTAMEIGASTLLIGLHRKARVSDSFLGKFTTDLLEAMQREVLIYRPVMPLALTRRIHILVPKRAEYEKGFVRWLGALARMADQCSSGADVYATAPTIRAMQEHYERSGTRLSATWTEYNAWADLSPIVHRTRQDHLVVIVMARRGTLSYHKYMEQVPVQVERYLSTRNLILLYPDQHDASAERTALRSGVPLRIR